jgi:uncharacterized protein (DUF1778 family)
MSKKKSEPVKKTPSADRSQYLVTCSPDESAMFERVSSIEGDRTVQQWFLRMARVRARKVLEAEQNGTLDQL